MRPGQRSRAHAERAAGGAAAAGGRQIVVAPLELDSRNLGIVDNGVDTGALHGERHYIIAQALPAIRASTVNHIAFDEAVKRRQAVRIIFGDRLTIHNADGLHRSRQVAITVGHR